MLKENHVNGESKILELTIYLYMCCEHEAPSSCNTTVYLSTGKLCWRYNCYKRHGKPWDVEEGGDIGHTRDSTGKLLFSSIGSLVLTYLGKEADKYE